MSDDHRALRESLGAFALDQLPDAERIAVQAHLDGCPACRAELAQLVPLATALRTVDPDHLGQLDQPPTGLDEAIVSRIRSERDETASAARRRRWRPIAAAAAVVVAIGGGVLAGRQLAPDPPSRPLETVALEEMAPGIDASADVIAHTWGMEIVLTGEGFAAGEEYRVTVVDDDGAEVSAGEFIGVGDDTMVCNLNSSILRRDAARFEVRDTTDDVVIATTV